MAVSPDGLSAYVAAPDNNGGFGEVSDGAVAMFDRTSNGRLIQKPDPVGCISEAGGGRVSTGRPSRTPNRWRSAPTG